MWRDVAERLIEGLDSETVRGIVGGIIGESGSTNFEKVVNTIRGVIRQKGKKEDSNTKKEDERLIGLNSTIRVLLGVLQQNSTLIENFTRSFASMNLSTNQRGATTPYHNMPRETNRDQQRDPPKTSKAPEEQRNNWTAPSNQPRRGDYTTARGSVFTIEESMHAAYILRANLCGVGGEDDGAWY